MWGVDLMDPSKNLRRKRREPVSVGVSYRQGSRSVKLGAYLSIRFRVEGLGFRV